MRVVSAWALLLLINFLAGLLLPGRSLPLTPLLGTALVTVVLYVAHLLVPLEFAVPWLPLLLALAGLTRIRRVRWRANRDVAIVTVLMTAVLLLPFVQVGGPAGFGVHNNDIFYWAMADWRVETASFFQSSPEKFHAIPDEGRFQRWGLNYQSTFLRSVLDLRTYESVQITGAFGIYLTAVAVYALGRILRLSPWSAIAAAVLAAGNPFIHRLLLDAFLGWCFGISFVVGALALALRRGSTGWQGLQLGIVTAALATSYYDMLPIFGGVALLCILLRNAEIPWRRLRVAAAVFTPLFLPLAPAFFSAVLFASKVTFSTTYFRYDAPLSLFVHLFGGIDFYRHTNPEYSPGVPAILFAAVVAGLSVSAFRRPTLALVPVLLCGGAAVLLLTRGSQYQAHRMIAIAWVFLPLFFMNGIWRSASAVLIAAVFLQQHWLNAEVARSRVTLAAQDRQIGSEWLKSLPENARVFVDVPVDDNRISYGHAMYLEALGAFGVDDRRIVAPRVKFAYFAPLVPENPDLTGVTHAIRAKELGPAVQFPVERLIGENAKFAFYEVGGR